MHQGLGGCSVGISAFCRAAAVWAEGPEQTRGLLHAHSSAGVPGPVEPG